MFWTLFSLTLCKVSQMPQAAASEFFYKWISKQQKYLECISPSGLETLHPATLNTFITFLWEIYMFPKLNI